MPIFNMPTMNYKKRTPGLMLKNEQPRMNPELAQASYDADQNLPNPQIGPEPMQPETPPQSKLPKEPIGTRIKQSLFGSVQDGGVDEDLGVEKPDIKKTGLFTKASRMLLPMAVGMTGGLGLLPSLAAGYLTNKGAEEDQGEYDQALYNKRREKAFSQMKDLSKDQFEREKFEETKRANKAREGIGWSNVNKPRSGSEYKDETTLRKEFTGSPTYKNYETSRTGFLKMEKSLSTKDRSGFDDMGLIFNFMKTLDPDSVVREGEYKTAENNASLLQRFGVSLEKLSSGQRLTEQQRQAILNAARIQNQAHTERYEALGDKYSRMADEYGVNPINVAIGYKKKTSQPAQKTTKSGLKYEVIE